VADVAFFALFVVVGDGLRRERAALLAFPGEAAAAAERETSTLCATPASRTELFVREPQLIRHRVDVALGEQLAALECSIWGVSLTARNKGHRRDSDARTDDEWTQYSHGVSSQRIWGLWM
jgi:hypothetical protein